MRMASFDEPISIVVVASTRNPLGVTWILGLSEMGARLAVVDLDERAWDAETRKSVGIPEALTIIPLSSAFDSVSKTRVLESIGSPDVVFGWWGSKVLGPMQAIQAVFPESRSIHCLDTLPDASILLTELREFARLLLRRKMADGFIYYSEAMKDRFERMFRSVRNSPSAVMVEPFLLRSYGMETEHLPRSDCSQPRVIFSGRGDHLWTENFRMKKDALGPQLTELADLGVDVYVPDNADTRGHPNVFNYPRFSEADLIGGTFSTFVSTFDAHLAIYNEHNSTIRRRVAVGLSTRLAFGLTATAPLAVTTTSTFVEDLQREAPFAMRFKDIPDLRDQLGSENLLEELRRNLVRRRRDFSFENQSETIKRLFKETTSR